MHVLEKVRRGLAAADTQGALTQYGDTRRLIDGFTDRIRDMNTLTPEMHKDSNFGAGAGVGAQDGR